MSAVEFEDVTLTLGGRVVLANVGFSLADSEFVGVLGPNGSGKTTLMRAVLGLLRPARGRIRVLGQPAVRGMARGGNANVGYVPQSRSVAGLGLTGRDFVASAANGQRLGLPMLDRTARADVDRVLDLVDATALAARRLGELSGGERQRVLLAQALLGRPRLLLLDEPLAGLDQRHQRGVVELVRRLQRELGLTVLFSAHDLNPLLGALDRVLYLGGGQAALGSVAEVVTGPVLSRLYGTAIEVVRLHGRVFVLAADPEQGWHGAA